MQCFLPFIVLKLRINILLSPLNSAPFLLKFTNITSYLVVHSNLPWLNPSLLPYSPLKALFIKFFKNISLFSADYIITVSKNAKLELVQNTIINPDNVIPVLLGINHKIFNNDQSNILDAPGFKYILYIANSALHHNHINLIKAYQLLNIDKNNYYKLLLIMSNVDFVNTRRIRDFIVKNLLEEHISILQHVSYRILKVYYQNSTAYVFPSLSETFGLTTIEAMASGVPVIVSNCSSMPEINGDAALYFDPYNPRDIAEKINFVLQSEKQRYKMIKNGLDRVKRYNWENSAKQMIDIFNEK